MQVMLETERLHLAVLDEVDADQVLKYYMENRHFLNPFEPRRVESFYTLEGKRLELRLEKEALNRGEAIRFYLMFKGENEIIGTIALTNIIKGAFKSCYLGYKLSEKHVSKGYTKEALKVVIDYGFNTLGLHRIEANVMPTNRPSIAVVKGLVFSEEGLSRKYLKINGKWEDHLRFAMINPNEED